MQQLFEWERNFLSNIEGNISEFIRFLLSTYYFFLCQNKTLLTLSSQPITPKAYEHLSLSHVRKRVIDVFLMDVFIKVKAGEVSSGSLPLETPNQCIRTPSSIAQGDCFFHSPYMLFVKMYNPSSLQIQTRNLQYGVCTSLISYLLKLYHQRKFKQTHSWFG